jgi:hypothetical protein
MSIIRKALLLMLISTAVNAQIRPYCANLPNLPCWGPLPQPLAPPSGGVSGFLVGVQQIGPNAYLCKYQVGGQFLIISHSGPCPYSP